MGLRRVCLAYVTVAVVLSAGLNGLANGHHAPDGYGVAAVGMGVVIPLLVLLLGRIAGLAWRHDGGRCRRLATAVAVIGAGLLSLSVVHCQQAIDLLTGGGALLSSLLAVGIDCGLVAAEVVAVAAGDAAGKARKARKKAKRATERPKVLAHPA